MSIRIGIVEDLDEVREGLCHFIGSHSDFLDPVEFKTAEEALANLPGLHPDVVIMDINLPGLSGIECVRQLKSVLPNTQFMMFTVYENDDKVFEALKAGATGYLLKNTGIPQMIDAIKELHAGGSPMSSNIARKLVTHFQHKQPTTDLTGILSAREAEVLQLLAKGLLYKEIASKLSLSVGTVRQHIHNIYHKLHVQNRMEAINKAYGRS